MAYIGRGKNPIKNFSDNEGNQPFSGFNTHVYFWVRYDLTFLLLEIIMTVLVLGLAVLGYVMNNDSSIIDPIADTKNMFIRIQFGLVLGITIIAIVNHFLSKDFIGLIKRVCWIFVVSCIIMISLLCVKINLDKTYNREKFEQIYNQEYQTSNNNKYNKIDVKLTGVSIKTEKDFFVDECLRLYSSFKIKTSVVLGLHFILNILLIIEVIKSMNKNNAKEQIQKDDAILFDEDNVFKN